MDSRKLTDDVIEGILGSLHSREVDSRSTAYNPPIQEDYIKVAEKLQELGHKDKLMEVVSYLAKESFKLLALIVVAQMIIRLFMPEYNGVSDTVINILAVSVFGQVIVVVGSLAMYLFRKEKSTG